MFDVTGCRENSSVGLHKFHFISPWNNSFSHRFEKRPFSKTQIYLYKEVNQYNVIVFQGSHILTKLRPVDQLRLLLIDSQGPDAEEVKGFFRLHKVHINLVDWLIGV